MSANADSTSRGKSCSSPMSSRPSITRRTAARVAVTFFRAWSISCRSSASRCRRRPSRELVDVVLELVDLEVESVDEIEVALGDVVDEPVDQPARAHRRRRRDGSVCAARDASAEPGLAHGHEPVAGRDERPARGSRSGSPSSRWTGKQEQAEQDAALALEHRSRVAPVAGRSRQGGRSRPGRDAGRPRAARLRSGRRGRSSGRPSRCESSPSPVGRRALSRPRRARRRAARRGSARRRARPRSPEPAAVIACR